MFGKDRGDVTIRPHPEQADIEDHIVELACVRLSGLIQVEAAVAGRHFVNSIGVQHQWLGKKVKGLLGIPVRIVRGHKPLVSPPQLDPRPVDG